MKMRLHLIIHGNVQGVFFRHHVHELANKLSLPGWVKNNPSGTVELLAEGEEDKLQDLLEFCKKGPAAAKVDKVEEQWGDYRGEFQGFKIR